MCVCDACVLVCMCVRVCVCVCVLCVLCCVVLCCVCESDREIIRNDGILSDAVQVLKNFKLC